MNRESPPCPDRHPNPLLRPASCKLNAGHVGPHWDGAALQWHLDNEQVTT